MKRFKIKLALPSLLLASVVWFSVLTPTVLAQFGQDKYGECAYGRACEVQPPDVPPPEPKDPEVKPDPKTDKESELRGEELKEKQEEQEEQKSEEKKEKQQKAPISSVDSGNARHLSVIAQEILSGLSSAQISYLPYFLWLFLLLLAIILLLQAYIDRRKVIKLAKAIEALRDKFEEQNNFIRLVTHHLGTPLATIKNTIELIGSGSGALAEPGLMDVKLTAAQLELLTVDTLKSLEDLQKLPEPDRAKLLNDPKASKLARWYYLVPVVVAVVLTFLVNGLLFSANIYQPIHNFAYQAIVAIVSALIFINAVRIFLTSRARRKTLRNLEVLATDIDTKRQQVVYELSKSLIGIIAKLKRSKADVAKTNYIKFIDNAIFALESLQKKTKASVARLSDNYESCSVPSLIQLVIDDYKLEASKKQIEITTDNSIQGFIDLPINDLRFVANAVIENAISYSRQGGKVNIRASNDTSNVYIAVKDEGVGMDNEELSNLFQAFSKTKSGVLTYDNDGMGLSLHASRQLLERLGGRIDIKSKKLEGSLVTISLPIK
jgi:signal transduction histidine kinase